jgi:hypothetical protein
MRGLAVTLILVQELQGVVAPGHSLPGAHLDPHHVSWVLALRAVYMDVHEESEGAKSRVGG